MSLSAVGSDLVFLKARSMGGTARGVLKGDRTKIKEAARLAATGKVSPIKPIEVLRAEQPVSMSKGLPSYVAKELEELQRQRMQGSA